jgi:flagellar motility protein MotE (MotC chaperone)
MKLTIKYAKVYLPATLLGFLIVKLMLGGALLYMKQPVLPVPVLNSTLALAEDADSPTPSQPSLNSQNLGASAEILEGKRAEVEAERRQLERERKQLTALKQEIEAKLVRLSEIQDSIQGKLDEHKTIQDNKIKRLIKIYTTMAPKKAATLIEKLDKELIMQLFSQMKVEQVGQILPHMSAENAAKIGEHLARRK